MCSTALALPLLLPQLTSSRAMALQMSVRASSAKPPHPVSAMDRESSTATTT